MSTLIVGCGYLGQHVARQLLDRGERVWGVVRSRARADQLAALGVEPVIADVLDRASLRTLPGAERVLYAVGFDRAAGVPMRTVYVDGLRNVLEHIGRQGVRLVYASSTGVYGQHDGGWVDEDSPAQPTQESGRVCLEAETVARDFGSARGYAVIVLRLAGLYGPDRIPRRASVERGEPIGGEAAKHLNFVHVEDAAAAAVVALERGAPGRLYNVADDRPVTRAEFYGRLAECLHAPPPRFVAPAEGKPEPHKRVSNRRLRQELGVMLRFPDVLQGLARVVFEGAAGRETSV